MAFEIVNIIQHKFKALSKQSASLALHTSKTNVLNKLKDLTKIKVTLSIGNKNFTFYSLVHRIFTEKDVIDDGFVVVGGDELNGRIDKSLYEKLTELLNGTHEEPSIKLEPLELNDNGNETRFQLQFDYNDLKEKYELLLKRYEDLEFSSKQAAFDTVVLKKIDYENISAKILLLENEYKSMKTQIDVLQSILTEKEHLVQTHDQATLTNEITLVEQDVQTDLYFIETNEQPCDSDVDDADEDATIYETPFLSFRTCDSANSTEFFNFPQSASSYKSQTTLSNDEDDENSLDVSFDINNDDFLSLPFSSVDDLTPKINKKQNNKTPFVENDRNVYIANRQSNLNNDINKIFSI